MMTGYIRLNVPTMCRMNSVQLNNVAIDYSRENIFCNAPPIYHQPYSVTKYLIDHLFSEGKHLSSVLDSGLREEEAATSTTAW